MAIVDRSMADERTGRDKRGKRPSTDPFPSQRAGATSSFPSW
jgi:hypothetical protein